MNSETALKSLLEEYGALRGELAGANERIFQLTLGMGIAAGAGLVVTLTSATPKPVVLLFIALVALVQLAVTGELNCRVVGLASRVKAVESCIDRLADAPGIMMWERSWVSKLCAPRDWIGRLVRHALVLPLVAVYAIASAYALRQFTWDCVWLVTVSALLCLAGAAVLTVSYVRCETMRRELDRLAQQTAESFRHALFNDERCQ